MFLPICWMVLIASVSCINVCRTCTADQYCETQTELCFPCSLLCQTNFAKCIEKCGGDYYLKDMITRQEGYFSNLLRNITEETLTSVAILKKDIMESSSVMTRICWCSLFVNAGLIVVTGILLGFLQLRLKGYQCCGENIHHCLPLNTSCFGIINRRYSKDESDKKNVLSPTRSSKEDIEERQPLNKEKSVNIFPSLAPAPSFPSMESFIMSPHASNAATNIRVSVRTLRDNTPENRELDTPNRHATHDLEEPPDLQRTPVHEVTPDHQATLEHRDTSVHPAVTSPLPLGPAASVRRQRTIAQEPQQPESSSSMPSMYNDAAPQGLDILDSIPPPASVELCELDQPSESQPLRYDSELYLHDTMRTLPDTIHDETSGIVPPPAISHYLRQTGVQHLMLINVQDVLQIYVPRAFYETSERDLWMFVQEHWKGRFDIIPEDSYQ